MKTKVKTSVKQGTQLLFLVILLVFQISAWGQKKAGKINAASMVEGKTFVINIYSFDEDGKTSTVSSQDEIVFVGGKFHSKNMGTTYKYSPDSYSCAMDSAQQAGGVITFVAFTKNAEGEVEIFWKGTVTGDTIKGSMHWFSKGTTRLFSGSLKYAEAEK